MSRHTIKTDKGPAAIGAYSQAVVAGGFIFVSGQIPIDPDTGEMSRGDIGAQTERVIRNLAGILEAAGVSLDRVVKTTVYLADMGDFQAMNEVYGRFFGGDDPPARAAVEVSALPKGATVEIEAVALAG